jgi:hypothetical protein
MLIPIVGLQEVSERKFDTKQLKLKQDFNTTQLKSNQSPSHFAHLVHPTYIHTSGTNMNKRKKLGVLGTVVPPKWHNTLLIRR